MINRNIYLSFTFLKMLFLLNVSTLKAQSSPFTLSPKWYFGNLAGLDFTSGEPTVLTDGKVNGWGQESSSIICDQNKNVVLYSDSYRLYDFNHNIISLLNGGTSSTQSSVAVPDPSDPSSKYYLFTANVDNNGSGEKPSDPNQLGIYYYRIQKLASTISIIEGPVKIANHNEVSEQISSSVDGEGNYWIITHDGGNYSSWAANKFWAWKITSSGVQGPVKSSITGTTGNNVWQGSIKINKCQNRLGAVFSTNQGVIEVYEWDATAGKVTKLIQRVSTGLPPLYGCEFSPDGNILYATSLGGNMLYQLEISSGVIYSDPAWTSSNNKGEMGTMQLGPDDKIYVTNVSDFDKPCYLGVINNPNFAGEACNYDNKGFKLNDGSSFYPNIQRGIANIAWLNPLKALNVVDNCPSLSLNYTFKSYFNETLSPVVNSEEWDFDDGSGFKSGLGANPNFTYGKSGTYNIRLRFKDQTCNNTWSLSQQVKIDCVLPVVWVSIKAENKENTVKVSWSTGSELNNNYFIIERSTDGFNFEPIGSKKGSGTSITNNQYTFVDEHPSFGELYYRIAQVDFDGGYRHSPLTKVNNTKQDVIVYPNPAIDLFNINIPSEKSGNIRVIDVLGREIFIGKYFPGMMLGENWKPGTYVIYFINETSLLYKEVIKN